jgi:hypothetical protein
VKNYLVTSLRMDRSKIVTRGFGRYEPLITTGTSEEQSANRRVEIRMRTTPPTKDQMTVVPQKAAVIEEPPAPKAILVKPKRALPVEEELPPPPLRANPVEEFQPLPEVEIPRAIPRAQQVE